MTSPPPLQDYCLFWIDHWATCMPRAEWSAWTQAVGAILALVVVVGIAWQQNSALRHTQTMHADLLVDAGLATIRHHLTLLGSLKPSEVVRLDFKFLRDAIQPFDGILAGALPQEALARIVATRQLMLTLANCIDDWNGRLVSECPGISSEVQSATQMAKLIQERKWAVPKP